MSDELLQHHRQILKTAGYRDQVARSLEWLRTSSLPGAAEVLAEFLRTPSRRVMSFGTREVSEYDSPNLAYETFEQPCYTSALGQPAGPEELAELAEEAARAVANADGRQAFEEAEAKRRHRENVYPVLLTHGEPQDVEDYAYACLTNPRYDFYLHEASRDPGTPKLNTLATYVRRASDLPRAAALLRLILAGDRTRLWASVHEALAWRGQYGGQIDWKPLAVELLEVTGDPGSRER